MHLRVVKKACRFAASTLLLVAAAKATAIYDSGVTALTSSDPTEIARINRNSVVSNWSVAKPFPGAVLGPITGFRYATYTIPALAFPFLQITFNDISGTASTFASAYLNSFQPGAIPPNYGLNTNYLGDAGTSGNFFAADARVFQVRAPVSSTLVIVVNDATGTSASLGQNYRIIVEGFYDSNFNDTVPEPGTLALSASALATGLGFIARQRRRNRKPVMAQEN
jgi:hypothetical protein